MISINKFVEATFTWFDGEFNFFTYEDGDGSLAYGARSITEESLEICYWTNSETFVVCRGNERGRCKRGWNLYYLSPLGMEEVQEVEDTIRSLGNQEKLLRGNIKALRKSFREGAISREHLHNSLRPLFSSLLKIDFELFDAQLAFYKMTGEDLGCQQLVVGWCDQLKDLGEEDLDMQFLLINKLKEVGYIN